MNFKVYLLLYFVAASTFISVECGSKKNGPKKAEKEAIFIDDEDMEGSGLGKLDAESSGSGFGPDDEDTGHDAGGNIRNLPEDPISNSDKEDVTIPLPTERPNQTPPPQNPTDITVDPMIKHEQVPVEKETPTEGRHPETKSGFDVVPSDDHREGNGVYMDNGRTSFFAQPGILAAVICGAVVGLLCAILVVMFIVYRMRKKDEGSYALEEMKRSPAANPYMKPNHREIFA